MAIAGNGFVEFERAARFAKAKLGAHKAMIVFIPDDMFRQGDKMIANDQCSTYQNYVNAEVVNCQSGRPTWHHYDRGLSDTELEDLARSKQRYGLLRTLRRPAIEWGTTVVRWLCRQGMRIPYDSALARRINSECDANPPELLTSKVAEEPASKVPEYIVKGPSRDQGTTIPAYTVTALKRILTDYGPDNVMLVAVPGGSNTVRATRPDLFFTHVFAGDFKSMFHFVDLSETCVLTPEMWGTGGGGHPNVEGYRKLQSCFLANAAIVNFSIR
jgi:hypothetical protein